jgi:hypothetical protein
MRLLCGRDLMINDPAPRPVMTALDTTMVYIMTTAMAKCINSTGGTQPDDRSLKGLIELISPTNRANMVEAGTFIKGLCQDKDCLVSFFDN